MSRSDEQPEIIHFSVPGVKVSVESTRPPAEMNEDMWHYIKEACEWVLMAARYSSRYGMACLDVDRKTARAAIKNAQEALLELEKALDDHR